MNWTVTLFPENEWHEARVLHNVVEYETLRSPTKYKGTRQLTYAIFTFADNSHITVLMDNIIHEDQQSYRKFEIHNHRGNFVVAHGRRGPVSYKGITGRDFDRMRKYHQFYLEIKERLNER